MDNILITIANNISLFYNNSEISKVDKTYIQNNIISEKSKYNELYKAYNNCDDDISISNIDDLKTYIERCYNGNISLSKTLSIIDGVSEDIFNNQKSFYKNKYKYLCDTLTLLKQNFIEL